MNGIKDQFGDKIDLITLNVDVPETRSIRDRFGLTDRSQYAFVDPKGTVIQRWYGYLDQVEVAQVIQDYLANNT